jgi:hypothetical protein
MTFEALKQANADFACITGPDAKPVTYRVDGSTPTYALKGIHATQEIQAVQPDGYVALVRQVMLWIPKSSDTSKGVPSVNVGSDTLELVTDQGTTETLRVVRIVFSDASIWKLALVR